MERRKKILLVDPESNCRLVDNGVVSWLIEFNKKLVYQYHEPTTKDKDYLTIVGSEYGTMDLFRHRQRTKEEISSQMVWCPKEEDIEEYLNTEYGEKLECVAKSRYIYVGETGNIGENSENNFLIVRKSYRIKFYSTNKPNKTTISWQLNFSRFTAFHPLNRAPIQVFHTINKYDFYKFCTNFNVKNPFNISLLKDLKWKLPQNEEKGIELCKESVPYSKMVYGKCQGVTVGVEKLERKGDFSKHVENLRKLGVHENIMEFITAETNGIHDMFAYHIMYAISMRKYVSSMCDTTSMRTSLDWIKVLRGMINGLQFLHIHDIRHGKLNLDNVFVKDNYTAKLAGLANIDMLSNEQRRGDLREYLRVDVLDWGKILLSMMTKGVHGGDETWDNDKETLEEIFKKFGPEDEEVKDLLRKVLHKNYKKRPKFEEILQHPVFCDWQSRIELLTELSDFCELKKIEARKSKSGAAHPVVQALDDVVGPMVFGTSWKDIFDNDDVLQEAQKHRTHDYLYDKLTDLLRLFRNIISHLSEFKKIFKNALGNTKLETEYIFRKKYPNFFMEVREVAKTHLDVKFRDHFNPINADFITESPQILENPYIF